MGKQVDFETSAELRRIFTKEFDAWRDRHRLGLEELSARCGVSSSYLAHVGRYGRIPSKPVLLLLALNFGMSNPTELLAAAQLSDPWPFEPDSQISRRERASEGFLSVRLDMAGFVEAIKTVVREESRPRTLNDLLQGRPLRVGLNLTQPWLFGANQRGEIDYTSGLLPQLCSLLENALRCKIVTSLVPFRGHIERLRRAEIDVFGPMLATPQNPSNILFSSPISRCGMSAVLRARDTHSLDHVTPPTRWEALRDPAYKLAVIRDSRAHLIANTKLNRSDDTLVICDTIDEGVDRVLMKGISHPAHIFICSSINACRAVASHPEDLKILFNAPETLLDVADNALAIRPDWPEAVPMINNALAFILGATGFSRQMLTIAQNYGPGLIQPICSFSQAANT